MLNMKDDFLADLEAEAAKIREEKAKKLREMEARAKTLEPIFYDELYENVYNRNWPKWKNLGDLMAFVEESGSYCKRFPESRVKHALNFLNSYLLEKRVAEVLHLKFFGDDHEAIYPKRGEQKPDFIDAKGETYELKERWSFDEGARAYWNDADHCLLHLKSDNCLYEFHRKEGRYEKICYLRASYVNIKNYPYDDKDLF